jgi:hypothetical protein
VLGFPNTAPGFKESVRVKSRRLSIVVSVLGALLLGPCGARAQGGPPYLTTDPGTPGNGNWELNLGGMLTQQPGSTSSQLPLLDVNFGVGERIQLSYEIPYAVQSTSGAPQHSGWGNALFGVKWRFLDQGDEGWQVSTFPQIETAGSARAQREGLAIDGPRLLLPVEVARKVGPLDVNFEAGYFLSRNGPDERFFGLVAGRQVTPRLELDGEIFNDRASGAPPNDTTLDFGLRYKLHPAFILLFMAGRSVRGDTDGHAQFLGYLGLQILLSDYGRTLMHEPAQ